jgi:hypothetical protein
MPLEPIIEKVTWLNSEIGSISPDSVAILGTNSQIHLFDGSNKHYFQYFDPAGYQISEKFSDSIAAHTDSLNQTNTKFQVHISPNKSTCLNKTFGLYTPNGMTVAMKRLIAENDPAVTVSFLDENGDFESDQSMWWKTDCHVNSLGAYSSALQILKKWNIDILPVATKEYVNEYTDLSYRWPGVKYLEPVNRRFFSKKSMSNHEYVYQNYDSESVKLRGRCSITVGNSATEESLLVVGQSTMGHGLVPENVSYWILPHFKTSVVLTEAQLPTLDFLSKFSHVLFSLEERFIFGGIGVDIFNSLISSQGSCEDFQANFEKFFG